MKIIYSLLFAFVFCTGCATTHPRVESYDPAKDPSKYPIIGISKDDVQAILNALPPDANVLLISVEKDAVHVNTGEYRMWLNGKGVEYELKRKDGKWVVVTQSGWVS